jgi:hypothetical protein
MDIYLREQSGLLPQEFFHLRTPVAGDIVQEFVQYRRRMVIIGDLARRLAESSAFAAFVTEANRGSDIWFLPDSGRAAVPGTSGAGRNSPASIIIELAICYEYPPLYVGRFPVCGQRIDV